MNKEGVILLDEKEHIIHANADIASFLASLPHRQNQEITPTDEKQNEKKLSSFIKQATSQFHRVSHPTSICIIECDTGKSVAISRHTIPFAEKQYTILIVRDAHIYKQAEENWRKFEFIANSSREFMTLISRNYVYEAVNNSYCFAIGMSRESIENHSVSEVWGDKKFRSVIKPRLDECFSGKEVYYQSSFTFPKIGIRFMEVTYYPYCDALGNVTHAAVVSRDYTEKKKIEDQLRHNAFYDYLTNLPNRMLFTDRLKQTIHRAKRNSKLVFAVLFIDVDRFKIVNDTLGHGIGDQLLVSIARRMEQCLREGDTIARLGGDEFVFLIDGLSDQKAAIHIAQRIRNSFLQPYLLGGKKVTITTSIGIAFYTPEYTEPSLWIRDADTAMYQAKAKGRDHIVLFDQSMHHYVKDVLETGTNLRQAIQKEELVNYFQPIIAIQKKCVAGYEMLLRWKHPQKGLLFPDSFIPIAEESGLIETIGKWSLIQACKQLRTWQEQRKKKCFISVNISPRQFLSTAFSHMIADIIDKHSISPDTLWLEITETTAMVDMDKSKSIMKELQVIGVKIVIDDFGKGQSCLNYLRSFPVDVLKIDKVFIDDLLYDDDDKSLAISMIDMGHRLGLQVISEGVEVAKQLELLSRYHCDFAQGYHISKPVPRSKL